MYWVFGPFGIYRIGRGVLGSDYRRGMSPCQALNSEGVLGRLICMTKVSKRRYYDDGLRSPTTKEQKNHLFHDFIIRTQQGSQERLNLSRWLLGKRSGTGNGPARSNQPTCQTRRLVRRPGQTLPVEVEPTRFHH